MSFSIGKIFSSVFNSKAEKTQTPQTIEKEQLSKDVKDNFDKKNNVISDCFSYNPEDGYLCPLLNESSLDNYLFR